MGGHVTVTRAVDRPVSAKNGGSAGKLTEKATRDTSDKPTSNDEPTPTVSLLDQLTGTAGDLADVYKSIKGQPAPVAPKAAAAPAKDNTVTFIAIGGGVLVLVLVLVFALRK